MSEAIKIKEGGVDRSQNQINKLKTNTVGGGVCFWVPETERQTDDKRITANGTYTAEDEGLYGYDEIDVSVSNTGNMSGKGADGNDYSITVDDNGYIVETKIPSAIQITTPPPKVSYVDGEAIDYSGIVATLYDGNGNVFTDSRYPDGTIPVSELTFPVTVAHAEGGEWTDGSGLNAMQIAYTSHRNRAEWVKIYPGRIDENQVFVCETALGEHEGHPATLGASPVDNTPGTLLVTRYYNSARGEYQLYAASMVGDNGCDLYDYYAGELTSSGQRILTGWFHSGGSATHAGNKEFSVVSWGVSLTNIPESTVVPTTVDPTTLHAAHPIPVNWISPYNSNTYTDTFDIIVR